MIWEQLVSAKYKVIVRNSVIFFHDILLFVSSILYLVKAQPKAITLEDDEDDDVNMNEDDVIVGTSTTCLRQRVTQPHV